jgi:hypothetical protein
VDWFSECLQRQELIVAHSASGHTSHIVNLQHYTSEQTRVLNQESLYGEDSAVSNNLASLLFVRRRTEKLACGEYQHIIPFNVIIY